MNKLALCIGLVLLGGCAAHIPEGMPTAMLRFTADGYMSLIVPECPDDKSLVKMGFVNNPYWSEVSPVSMIGTRTDKTGQVMERLIPAERVVGFAFPVSRPLNKDEVYECSLAFFFTPSTGHQYHAEYLWPQGSTRCTVRLTRLSESGGKVLKTNIQAKVVNVYEARQKINEFCSKH